jgi:menaquinone-dependent protoporphyrinogen oxidase
MHILVPYASVHGSTAEIAQFMAEVLYQKHMTTTVAPVETVRDIRQYDVILPGAPVHGGMWLKPMMIFLRHHQTQLQEKIVFPWLTCVRVLEPGGYRHVIENYLPPEVLSLPRMMGSGVFAGKMDAPNIDLQERWTFALRYDGGDTMTWLRGDFRDWNKIRDWTEEVVEKLNSPVFSGV